VTAIMNRLNEYRDARRVRLLKQTCICAFNLSWTDVQAARPYSPETVWQWMTSVYLTSPSHN